MSTKTSQIFRSNSMWKVLSFFLNHPSSEVYVKELARKLRMGPSGVNNTLRRLAKMGFLQRRKRARSHFYSLTNESSVIKQLKIALFLARLGDAGLVRRFLEVDDGLISLSVYGSYANGMFDEASDLDILLRSHRQKTEFGTIISVLEDSLGLNINVEIFSLAKWGRVKRENRGFYQEVTTNSILLYGSELV
ncbi:MarR family transcriptional regulator [candidate division TA06 bacterium]|uniref:MarR family transcriptional regulator n=1 Tax=candidate division TA06 bacterium TaxID=2250710 RepID=A0A523XMZ3_UNCT6|nr:MAG: MarR family transcriptional regulator [candidate division TA06 bacterium]